MYARQQFREASQEVMIAAMRDIGFATLVAFDRADSEAVHIPMIVRQRDETLTLEGQVSAANPFWRIAAAAARALAIFQGAHAYVSPRWLESERASGRTVPTWSYVAVHARGTVAINKDREWLLAHVEELASINELGRASPWSVSEAPSDYVEGLLGAIVGLQLKVDHVEGTWKMLQHRPEADRHGAIAGLSASERMGDRAMAAIMQEHEDKRADRDRRR